MFATRLTVIFSFNGKKSLISFRFIGDDSHDVEKQIREYIETMEDKGYEVVDKHTENLSLED